MTESKRREQLTGKLVREPPLTCTAKCDSSIERDPVDLSGGKALLRDGVVVEGGGTRSYLRAIDRQKYTKSLW